MSVIDFLDKNVVWDTMGKHYVATIGIWDLEVIPYQSTKTSKQNALLITDSETNRIVFRRKCADLLSWAWVNQCIEIFFEPPVLDKYIEKWN